MAALDPESIDLPTLASLAGTLASEHLLARLRKAGHPHLRSSHGYVFQHLLDSAPTVGELADRLGVTQQAASKSVLELESLGYVERQPDEGDSRIRRVTLTARGRSVIQLGRSERAKLEAEVTSVIGARNVAIARRALVALLARAGGLEAVASRRVKLPTT